MKTKYLSYAQASAISNDFQHLKGQPFDDSSRIEYVTVGPYSRILLWQFLHAIIFGGRSTTELSFRNPTGRYDVFVVAKTNAEPGFAARDIRSYLKEHKIEFDPSRYACLRGLQVSGASLKGILR